MNEIRPAVGPTVKKICLQGKKIKNPPYKKGG
jgi:hypothetical protein